MNTLTIVVAIAVAGQMVLFLAAAVFGNRMLGLLSVAIGVIVLAIAVLGGA